MGKIIFSKFSNERKIQYQIITKIVKQDGKKIVLKEAFSKQAQKHIESIVRNKDKLQEYYISDDLIITPCRLLNDTMLEFDYIDGESYEEFIRKLVLDNDFEKLKNSLVKLKNILMQVTDVVDFQLSNEFIKVFGKRDYAILEKKEAYRLSNIDVIFANIIIKNGKLFITDYEWVFDFAVPINYILYRSLLLCSDIANLEQMKKEELYRLLEIDEEQRELYFLMEKSFQEYVSGKNIFLEYQKKSKNQIFKFDYIPESLKEKYYDIYVSDKDENKIFIERKQIFENEIDFTYFPKQEDTEIELHFGFSSAVLGIKSVSAFNKPLLKKDLNYETNSDLCIGNDYYFKSQKPIFSFKNQNYEKIRVKITLYYSGTTLIHFYVDKILECSDKEAQLNEKSRQLILKEEDIRFRDKMISAQDEKIKKQTSLIQDKESDINVLQKELEEANLKIKSMENTKLWKLYQKILNIKNKIFGIK